MKRLCQIGVAALAASAAAQSAGDGSLYPDGPSHWDRFAPEPLTIVTPEEASISNPPFFHWQHDPSAEKYTVTLSGGGREWSWETERNFLMPASGVAPGRYTVTIEAQSDSGGSEREATRHSFVIEKEADGLKFELEGLRLESGAPIGWSENHMQKVASAGGEMAHHREKILEMARQPASERLRNPEEPRRYPDGKWEWSVWNANTTLTDEIENRVAEQLTAFALTGEKRFAEEAKRLLLRVAAWDPAGATGVWENDHSAHSTMRALALGYSHLGEELSKEERAQMRDAISGRCEDLYAFLNPFVEKETSAGPMNDPANNHPWFCTTALAVGALALGPDDSHAEQWASFAAQMYRGVFLPRGDSRGGWHEGNDYWSYMLFFVFQYTDAMRLATGMDFLQHPWLRNTGNFKVYVHPPDGGYVPFANCKHKKPTAFDKTVMMRLASAFDDPLLWRYVREVDAEISSARDRRFALLWGVDDPPTSDGPFEFPFAVHYEDMGWVVSNSAPFDVSAQTIFAFRAGPFAGRGYGHIHADQNHFVLTAGRDKLLWDAGYYDGYLSPHNRDFSRTSKAHNTILVDGKGQQVQIAGLDAEIATFEQSGTTLTVTGDASNPILYEGRVEKFRRKIDYDLGHRSLNVKDTIRLKEPGEISFLLHSAHPIAYRSGDRMIEILGADYRLAARFVSEIPFTVTVRDTFPVPPKPPQGKMDTMPNQYHLEIRTSDAVVAWEPELHARWWPADQAEQAH